MASNDSGSEESEFENEEEKWEIIEIGGGEKLYHNKETDCYTKETPNVYKGKQIQKDVIGKLQKVYMTHIGIRQMKVKALFPYEKDREDELSITKDEELTALGEASNDWIEVKNASGETGLVPQTYIMHQSDVTTNQEFKQFCETYKISDDTKEKLESEGFDDLENLKEITDDEIQVLGLNMGQKKSLKRGRKALQETGSGGTEKEVPKQKPIPERRPQSKTEKKFNKEVTVNEFDQFCKQHNLLEETKDLLLKQDITTPDALCDLEEKDLGVIGIKTLGQRKALLKAVAHRKSTAEIESGGIEKDRKKSRLKPEERPKKNSIKPEERPKSKTAKKPNKEGKVNEFDQICNQFKVLEETRNYLLKQDISTLEALRDLGEGDIQEIGIKTIGQRRALQKAIDHLNSTAEIDSESTERETEELEPVPVNKFDQFCKQHNLQDKTKDLLLKQDISTLEALHDLGEEDIQEIGIKTIGQRRALQKAIAYLNSTAEIDSEDQLQENIEEPLGKPRALPREKPITKIPWPPIRVTLPASVLWTTFGYSLNNCVLRLIWTFATVYIPTICMWLSVRIHQMNKLEINKSSRKATEEEKSQESTSSMEEEGFEDNDEEYFKAEDSDHENEPDVHSSINPGKRATTSKSQLRHSAKSHMLDKIHATQVYPKQSNSNKLPKQKEKKMSTFKAITGFAQRFIRNLSGRYDRDHYSDTRCDNINTSGRIIQGGNTTKDGLNIHKLPLLETYRDDINRIRKCQIGMPNTGLEKTLLLVGATGSGKTTMIDGMVNYIYGTQWEEDIRLSLVDLEDDEKGKKSEALSQTEWITAYSLEGTKFSNVNFSVTIVDMPGFGDTRGIERDKQLVKQLKHFFSMTDGNGIESVDAVCFIAQAGESRLTPTQRYIFDQILGIFGNDIRENIQVLITFADGDKPAVLSALQAAKVPYTDHFTFNNSALFTKSGNRFTEMFWKMGMESYEKFFQHLKKVTAKSLTLTAQVLRKREQLNIIVHNLEEQIQKAVLQITKNTDLEEQLKEKISSMDAHKNYVEIQEIEGQERRKTKDGEFVTYCRICKMVCHDSCFISEDNNYSPCFAMDDKNTCKVCPEHCSWTDHVQRDFIEEKKVITIRKTIDEVKAIYQAAFAGKQSIEATLEPIRKEREELEKKVDSMVKEVQKHLKTLEKIALKKGPPSEADYIDILIEQEKQKEITGYSNRIAILEKMKTKAKLLEKVTKGETILVPSSSSTV